MMTHDNYNITAVFDRSDSRLNRELLREPTEEAQNYRRDLLAGRWIAIIAAGIDLAKVPQYLHLISADVRLGKVFFVEEPVNPLVQAVTEAADSETISDGSDRISGRYVHVPISLKNRPNLVDDVAEALENAVHSAAMRHIEEGLPLPPQTGNSVKGWLSGIFTVWDDAVCLSSRLAAKFGLPGDVPRVVDVCHDKLLARKAIENGGVRGPANRRLESQEDAKTLGKELKYPIILKPINGAASIGVSVINTHDELVAKFQACQADLDDIYAADELMGLTFADGPTDGATDISDLRTFVAEEFINGKEYDCDMVFSEGECVYANINEDWDFKDGWLCERGMHHPASLPDGEYRELWMAAANCAKLIGCRDGVIHVEMKWDPILGPQMIECNPRMGGAAVWQLHRNSWNCDLLIEACFAAVGIPNRPVLLDAPRGTGVSLILFSDQSGKLREDMQSYNEGIVERFETHQNGGVVDMLSVHYKKGDLINGWKGTTYPSHIGRLDLFYPSSKYDKDDAIHQGRLMRREIRVPFEAGDHVDAWY